MPRSFPSPRLILPLLLGCVLLAPARAQLNYETPYAFSILAGASSIGSNDGSGSAARFREPSAVDVDNIGNIYVVDPYNRTIRKITPGGAVTTLAGAAGQSGSTDGTGSNARFLGPSALAVDTSGNVYVADSSNHTIRKITPAGTVSTLAGSPGNYGSTDGTGSAARFTFPQSIAVDSAGNVYVGDFGSAPSVRKITPAGIVSTLAPLSAYSSDLAVDATGNVYVIEAFSNVIRKIAPDGTLSTLAGLAGYRGSVDGQGSAAWFERLLSLVVDVEGNIYAVEVNSAGRFPLRKITPAGNVTTVNANLGSSAGLALDATGNFYTARSNAILKITPAGTSTILAGSLGADTFGQIDGNGTAARFGQPSGITVAPSGDIYVADGQNYTIRKITAAGVVTTFAGSAGASGATNGTGSAARFSVLGDIAADSAGNLYAVDSGNRIIRKITPAGVVSTLAGDVNQWGNTDGTGTTATFSYPGRIAVDAEGNVHVTDSDGTILRKITPAGVVSTVAGKAGANGYVDGTGNAARFNNAGGLAYDRSGNIFVANPTYAVIRKVTPAGVVSTFAGSTETAVPNGQNIPLTDGSVGTARFRAPTAVAFDTAGDLYVSDGSSGSSIRKITPGGTVTTVAGTSSVGNTAGVGRTAGLEFPSALAVNADGILYVVAGNAILKGQPAVGPAISTQPQNQTVASGGSVSLSVTASGMPDPTYQWFFNGNAFSGGTSSSLSFSNARSTDAGDYTVVVTNAMGTVTSAKATLTVSAATTPSSPSGGSGGGGGGGGAPSIWFGLSLLTLAAVRRTPPQRT